jgi:hypothetical protein
MGVIVMKKESLKISITKETVRSDRKYAEIDRRMLGRSRFTA